MNKWIENINNFITSNRKSIITILFFILIFSFDNSFAEDPTKAAEESKNSWYIPLVLMSALAGFSGSLIWFFINPEWTNWSIFGLTDQLKNLWVLTSNIVYFIFAFMLILMAFMNIIGHGKNEYEMKTALPKFIVWILIVPFSWFIVQFVVSISSILTVSVLSLPYDLYKPSIDSMNMDIPTNCTLNVNSANSGRVLKDLDNANESTRSWRINSIWNCKDSKGISKMFQWDSIFSIMSIYAYWILKINTMDTMKWSQLSDLKSLTDVFLKLWFDVIFLIAFLLLSLAIAMALFVRWVYLWLFMILSPTFWLFYFLWDKHRKKLQEQYSFTQFLSLALVPVYVSAALSFWLLFILIAQNGIISSSSTWNWKFTAWWDAIEISEGNTFTITWLPGSQKTNTTDWAKSLLWTLWSLFLIFVSIAILWIAVMAALWSSKITENIVKPIADFWWNVWKLITEAPKYAPILPGGMSAQWLANASSTVKNNFENLGSTKWTKMWNTFSDMIWIWQQDEYLKKMNELLTKAKPTGLDTKSNLTTAISEWLNWLDLSDSNHKKKAQEYFKDKLNIELDLSNVKDNTKLRDELKRATEKTYSWKITNDEYTELVNGNVWKGTWTSSARWTASTNLPELKRLKDASWQPSNNINININWKETSFNLNNNKLEPTNLKTISDWFANDMSLHWNNESSFKTHLINWWLHSADADEIIKTLKSTKNFFNNP